MIYRLN